MEMPEGLTKKELGRIKAALTQSRLGLFNTNEKISSEASQNSISNAISRCTPDTKKLLDVFLCSSDTKPFLKKLFSTIDFQGISNVAEICSNPNTLESTSIRTIFGGTDHMPFRGLIYLLPAINLCEQLKENSGINTPIPNIEFLFMNGAGIIANAIDPEKTYQTTAQFIQIARKYIDEYHPDLSQSINFYIDRTFTASIIQTPEYQQMYQVLEKKLELKSNLRTDLIEMGERRNASVNSIKYATLHAFSQDGHIDPEVAQMSSPEKGVMQPEVDTIISIGAKPEEKFYSVRKLLVDEMSEVSFFKPKKTVQYIANINVPPYSPLKTGELYLDQVVRNPNLILEARMRGKNEEYSEYQMPVQKAVEMLIEDTENSKSEKSLLDFMEEISKSKEKEEKN